MEIDEANDLIFRTYYMLDWSKVHQTDSDHGCVSCGSTMKKVEPLRDKKGLIYDGFACHNCKSVFWLKRG